MNILYIVALLLSTDPYPVFAFLGDHDSLTECQKAITEFNAPQATKDAMGCMLIVKPDSFKSTALIK